MSAPRDARLGEGADWIGAGDEVVVLGRGLRGTLADAADEAAALVVDASGEWHEAPFALVAHPDSPAAREEADRAA